VTTKQDKAMSTTPTLAVRYGPEWWALYAVAWQDRWPVARRGVEIHHKTGGTEVVPGDRVAVAVMAAQDADEGIAAFNEMVSR
jgi:molybdopterin synthase catalytic subunit